MASLVPLTDAASAVPRAIESDSFPFEQLSRVAELESWRKEVHRPIYHTQKWWAQRLGTVFRAAIIGALAPEGTDVMSALYEPVAFPGRVVFDPFMGSGTTVGEALKLGARAIGRDVNPVAFWAVRTALQPYSSDDVREGVAAVEARVVPLVSLFYSAETTWGPEPVLYYFWVKMLPCPSCDEPVDLFSRRVFASHAYPKRHPAAKALCPSCGTINSIRFDATAVDCDGCGCHYDPTVGAVRGAKATCPVCEMTFPIAARARALGHPPEHRQYAKLLFDPDGVRTYMATTPSDIALYKRAEAQLGAQLTSYPVVQIAPGHNTNQVLKYGYRWWHEMFNARQLLCLGAFADALRDLPPERRDLLIALFSGTLEFNNMFASYKGEGTGAVRHMFSHHVLKPERTPLEANPWGTPRSSGSFSTLLESRLQRALDYKDRPFEIRPRVVVRGGVERTVAERVFGLSPAMSANAATSFATFRDSAATLYLSCGDSSLTDIDSGSVDAVVTDPPYFDFVHYSELADFFYIWQRHILGADSTHAPETTRTDSEVQHHEAGEFGRRLAGVWTEARRVLSPHGLLVFSFHHSRAEGWLTILGSLSRAGFRVTAVQPVTAELLVAAPKAGASDPITLDMLMVCRPGYGETPDVSPSWADDLVGDAWAAAERQRARLERVRSPLGLGDIRVVAFAHVTRLLSACPPEFISREAPRVYSLVERRLNSLGLPASVVAPAPVISGG